MICDVFPQPLCCRSTQFKNTFFSAKNIQNVLRSKPKMCGHVTFLSFLAPVRKPPFSAFRTPPRWYATYPLLEESFIPVTSYRPLECSGSFEIIIVEIIILFLQRIFRVFSSFPSDSVRPSVISVHFELQSVDIRIVLLPPHFDFRHPAGTHTFKVRFRRASAHRTAPFLDSRRRSPPQFAALRSLAAFGHPEQRPFLPFRVSL